MDKKLTIFLIVLISILFIGVTDASCTHYLSTSGSDGNSGTSVPQAWSNLSYACNQIAAGNTLCIIDDGTYYNHTCELANNGTLDNPITLIAYNGTPILSCTSPVSNVDYGIKISGKSYINVSGIELRRYWHHIDVRESDHIHISNCSVYTENIPLSPSSQQGITIVDGSSNCSVVNCSVEGDAWSSIQITGRQYYYGSWHDDPSTHITIRNCIIHDNTLHNLIDLFGNLSYVYILNNTLYNDTVGSIYHHQGFIDHLYIENNTIYDCYDGVHLPTAATNSFVIGNNITDINASNGHSIRIFSNITYGGTTVISSNNTIRDNYCRGDVAYGVMTMSNGKDTLFDSNDIFSGFGDAEYRIGESVTDYGTVRNAIGDTYKVVAISANVTVEYTNNKIFSIDGGYTPKYYLDKSNFTFSSGRRTFTTYPIFAIPSTGYMNLTVNTYDSSLINFTATNSTSGQTMNITVENGAFPIINGNQYTIKKDGAVQATETASQNKAVFTNINVGSEYIITESGEDTTETFINPKWVLPTGAFILAAGWLLKRWGNRRRKRQ